MSAHIVNKAHIDLLVSAAMPRQGRSLYWLDRPPTPEENEAMHTEGVALPGFSIEWWNQHKRGATPENADRIGAMLVHQNQVSVNWRYDDDELEEFYVWTDLAGFGAIDVLKAISGYEYQACEGPSWAYSEAKQFCEALQHSWIDRLPGYSDNECWSVKPGMFPESMSLASFVARKKRKQ